MRWAGGSAPPPRRPSGAGLAAHGSPGLQPCSSPPSSRPPPLRCEVHSRAASRCAGPACSPPPTPTPLPCGAGRTALARPRRCGSSTWRRWQVRFLVAGCWAGARWERVLWRLSAPAAPPLLSLPAAPGLRHKECNALTGWAAPACCPTPAPCRCGTGRRGAAASRLRGPGRRRRGQGAVCRLHREPGAQRDPEVQDRDGQRGHRRRQASLLHLRQAQPRPLGACSSHHAAPPHRAGLAGPPLAASLPSRPLRARRFDQQTSMEERRQTLETLLQVGAACWALYNGPMMAPTSGCRGCTS